METNRIPNNRGWKYEHDQLFFRPSPPKTPTLQRGRMSWCSADGEPDAETQPAVSFSGSEGDSHHQNSDSSRTSITETSSRNTSGAWNQYHVDRPPDFPCAVGEVQQLSDVQTSHGPTVDNQASVQQRAEDIEAICMSASPLSAVCVPNASQPAGNSTIRQEVIWPLNMVMSSSVDVNALNCF